MTDCDSYYPNKEEIIAEQKNNPEDHEKVYELFEAHKANIMECFPRGKERNEELARLLTRKIEFTLKFREEDYGEFKIYKYGSFMVYRLEGYKDDPLDIPSEVTELVVMPSEWYTGPVETRETEVNASTFVSSKDDGFGDETWRATEGGEDITLRVAPGITKIEDYAFSNPRFTKAYLAPTVKQIEDGAFFGSNLSSIYIPPSVEKIGGNAFSGNRNLDTVSGMKNVREIGTTPFNETDLRFIELHVPLDELLERETPFNMFEGTPYAEDYHYGDDHSPIYNYFLSSTIDTTNAHRILESITKVTLECKSNSPDDVKECLLNLPSGTELDGPHTEIKKFLSCQTFGYLRPSNEDELSRLYWMGIRCFDLTEILDDLTGEDALARILGSDHDPIHLEHEEHYDLLYNLSNVIHDTSY